ncbi:hypothetical protein Tsubulata_012420 [Turnera subulata]|uniref:Uncharacterized protein n=1 Tax=Turnera subulata TaxID=218843 RepID=A0A9Q0JQH1_9ROSI|nr:hypothetical protein Tsubulata_012420 [Turnera subulata]
MANNSFGICKYLIVLLFIFLSTPHLSLSSHEEEEDIHDFLPKYGLPRGLIPRNVESYTLSSSSGDFYIKLTRQCDVQIGIKDTPVWYDEEIQGKIWKGNMRVLSGINIKVGKLWCPVTGIRISSSDEVVFLWRCSGHEAFSAADFEKLQLSSNPRTTTAFMSKSVV